MYVPVWIFFTFIWFCIWTIQVVSSSSRISLLAQAQIVLEWHVFPQYFSLLLQQANKFSRENDMKIQTCPSLPISLKSLRLSNQV